MIRHAGNFCQRPEGERRGPRPELSVSGGAAREDEEEERDFLPRRERRSKMRGAAVAQ